MIKVLLASCSEIFLKRNANLLQEKGFSLFTATSGADVLSIHEEHHLDLILCDLQLKDMGGCTLCSLVGRMEHVPRVPVILMCLNVSGSMERAEQSGASAILLKPIEPRQLLDTIGSFVVLKQGRCKRVTLKTNVMIRAVDLEFLCLAHDISNSGILIETACQLPLGSRITCSFALSDTCRVEAGGEIVRYMNIAGSENLYGVKFIDMHSSDRKAIDNYLNLAATSWTKVIKRPLYTPRQYIPPQQ
jgi:CheY-like chemotaxis protein